MVSSTLSKSINKIKREIFSRVFIDRGGMDKIIYVAGGGRGGTTWLSDVLANLYTFRIIFEPFWRLHLEVDGKADYFHHAYIPQERAKKYRKEIEFVLSGNYRNYDTNANYKFAAYKGRVVKDICSNAFLPAIHALFPRVPIILVTRHPCAVALSRTKKREWGLEWGLHSHLFYDQTNFVNDILEGEVICPRNEFEDHAITYFLENLVPAKKMHHGKDVFIVSYEELVKKRKDIVRQIVNYIGKTSGLEVDRKRFSMLETFLDQPSMLTNRSRAQLRKTGGWRDELSPE